MSSIHIFVRKEQICLFPLGQIVATPGALDLLDRSETNAGILLDRHQSGDWGTLDPDYASLNTQAVIHGDRILSCYVLNGDERLWIITEWDRSVTTLLLPSEY